MLRPSTPGRGHASRGAESPRPRSGVAETPGATVPPYPQEARALLDRGTQAVLEAALEQVEVAGSVVLDLMGWPDIDL